MPHPKLIADPDMLAVVHGERHGISYEPRIVDGDAPEHTTGGSRTKMGGS
jgi:hypothetical protein